MDNIGKINSDTTRNYYLKDHLGSIRVVLNSNNEVVSAQDYDCWGYPLENRSYNSSAMKYDFTGKERDDETSYDYFGARYYDSRIGRWGTKEPQSLNYLQYSPYIYVLNNPINYFDPHGDSVYITGEYKRETFNALKEAYPGLNLTMKKGILFATGTASSIEEAALLEAIKSENNIIELKTTSDDFVDGYPLFVGMYDGNLQKGNKFYAVQYFNISHTWKLSTESFGSPGRNAAFEIIEALLGIQYNPNESGYTETGHRVIHEYTIAKFGYDWPNVEGEYRYYPEEDIFRAKIINTNTHDEVILYERRY